MFHRTWTQTAVLLIVLVGIGSWNPVEVLGAEIKTGDKVVTMSRAGVGQGKETVVTLDPGTELIVTEVRGVWVGVKGEHAGAKVVGWMQAADLKVQTVTPEKSETAAADYPRELAMQSLPAYRIEPPDLIQVEVVKLVPLPPYRLETYDVLQIQVLGTLENQPIDGHYLVEAQGTVNLGPAYGSVRVAGLTLEEITKVIEAQLRQVLKEPVVAVQLARTAVTPAVNGTYLVGPDGTINLRRYGAVHVAGKTLVEARLAIQKQLAQFLDSPEVDVDMAGYNSKVYYIITEGAGLGDNVVRVPITGNETVLDAISQIGGLSQLSSRKIWVARPAPADSGRETVLPVDWVAITRRGATATNYQIMPRDRVFIAEDSAMALNQSISKFATPVERVLGLISLGASTVGNLLPSHR